MGGARVGCRGELLTRRRAPQGGWTPLHCAAKRGHDSVVLFLVEKGADVTAKTQVSVRRVGGGRKGVRREKRFRGRVIDSLGESPHTCQDDCFLAPADDILQTNYPTVRCGCRVEWLLLHKMCFSGCWGCFRVRGVALMGVGYPERTLRSHPPEGEGQYGSRKSSM